jgi:hypothetical protein
MTIRPSLGSAAGPTAASRGHRNGITALGGKPKRSQVAPARSSEISLPALVLTQACHPGCQASQAHRSPSPRSLATDLVPLASGDCPSHQAHTAAFHDSFVLKTSWSRPVRDPLCSLISVRVDLLDVRKPLLRQSTSTCSPLQDLKLSIKNVWDEHIGAPHDFIRISNQDISPLATASE